MKRFFFTILYTLFLISLTGCQTVSKKIEDTTTKEDNMRKVRDEYGILDGEFYYCKPESTSWCDILKNNVPLDRLCHEQILSCHEQILSDEMREPNHYETEREKWAVLNARFLPDIPYEEIGRAHV